MVIPSLLLIVGQLSVTSERICTERLLTVRLSLPRKSGYSLPPLIPTKTPDGIFC